MSVVCGGDMMSVVCGGDIMSVVCGGDMLPYAMIKRRASMFHQGRTSLIMTSIRSHLKKTVKL